MKMRLIIPIKQSQQELELLYKRTRKSKARKKIKGLLLMKKQTYPTRKQLAKHLSIDVKTLYTWIKAYQKEGLDSFIKSTSGGCHNYKIPKEVRDSLEIKLNDSKAPLQGYTHAVEWVRANHNVEINYHTLRSFMVVNFGTKLKQPRKSHYKKDEQAFELFKKTSRTS